MNLLYLVPLFIALPLGAALLITILHRTGKSVALALASVASAGLFVMSLLSFANVSANSPLVYQVSGKFFSIPGMYLVVDALSGIMLVIINTVTLAAIVYSWSYIRHYTDEWKYYALFLLMSAGLNGVAITGDIFNLYVFLEVAAIASYSLVAFGCEQEELEASFKYIILGTLGSTFILFGIALLYNMTSSLAFGSIAATFGNYSGWMPGFIVALFIMGFGLKAAFVPFHAWLPDAHTSAPAPISSMLSGIVIKTLGVYALTRLLFNVLGLTPAISKILLLLATLSMVLGVLLALYQWDFKRLLAYSSISQIGYIMLGIGLATPLGILGGLFHLVNHAFLKPLLFMNAGAVEYSTSTRQLKALGGLRRRMPVTANTSLIASMSVSGIPPLGGFWSKLIIIVACVQAEKLGLAIVAAGASIVTLAYFLKVQKYAFWGSLNSAWQHIREVPAPMIASMVFLVILSLSSALLVIPSLSAAFLQPAVDTLMLGVKYGRMIGGQP